jgi:hypothetical protein
MNNLHHPPQTLTGILLPREWDNDGNIVALSLMTAGEKEYLVQSRHLASLEQYLRQEVKISCTLCGTNAPQYISVLSCRPARNLSPR